MPTPDLPPEVTQFIFEHVDSVEFLAVIKLLAGQAGRRWTADEVAAELRASPRSIALRLLHMVQLGLATVFESEPPHYQYSPSTDEQAATIAAVLEAYRVRPHRIYDLIFSPLKRARSFAEAFRVRQRSGDRDA